MRTIRTTLAAGLLLTSVSAWAQLDLDGIRQLIDAGKAHEAYREIVAYRDQFEGEPLFDFYYGLAAIETGRAEEGVFALSRVVMQQPRNARARLELARGFYLLGEDTRARQEFEAVLSQEPPAGVRATVQRFLDAIQTREATYRPTTTAYVQASAGYDSNINSAPVDDPYESLFGQETEWASEHASAFGQLDFGGQYTAPQSRQTAWFVRADGTWRSHTDGERFNNGSLTGQGGVLHQTGPDQLKLSAIAQSYVVDADVFRNLAGVTGEWNRLASPRFRYGASLTYAKLTYPEQESRDGRLMSVGANVIGGLGRGLWFGTGFVGREQADENTEWTDASVDRQFAGLRAGVQWPVGPQTTLTTSALYQAGRYAGEWAWPEENFERKRREDVYGAVDLELKRRIGDGLSLVGNVSYADNDSTVASYDYARSQLRIGLRYER